MSWSFYKQESLTLQKGVVHLWRVDLSASHQRLEALAKTVSNKELARSERFLRKEDGANYLVAKAFQRAVLSRYVLLKPQSLTFQMADHGKPSLTGDCGIQFNLSHSGRYAIMIVAKELHLGVDIERRREHIDVSGIVARFFSQEEKQAFEEIPVHEKNDAFYQLWVKKEAFAKATGYGLSFPLSEFTVTVPIDLGDEEVVVHNDKAASGCWVVRPVHMPDLPEYYAAISANGGVDELICRDYQFYEI